MVPKSSKLKFRCLALILGRSRALSTFLGSKYSWSTADLPSSARPVLWQVSTVRSKSWKIDAQTSKLKVELHRNRGLESTKDGHPKKQWGCEFRFASKKYDFQIHGKSSTFMIFTVGFPIENASNIGYFRVLLIFSEIVWKIINFRPKMKFTAPLFFRMGTLGSFQPSICL